MTIQILNGLVYGSLLLVLAAGLALIYGLRRVVNFAHGAFYMLGAYAGYTAAQAGGFWAGLAASAVVLALFGAVLDRLVFRALQDRDPLVTVIVTFGLLLVIEDAVQWIWGTESRSMDAPALLAGSVALGGDAFPVYRLAVIAMAVALTAALLAWLHRSRAGLFVRAASLDPATTAVQGVNTDAVAMLVTALGAALAGVSGVIAAPFLSLSPAMGGQILVDCFVVVVVGGLGSLGGAALAALLLGQVQVLGAVLLPDIAALIPFLTMAAVLVWRPTGLAGKRL